MSSVLVSLGRPNNTSSADGVSLRQDLEIEGIRMCGGNGKETMESILVSAHGHKAHLTIDEPMCIHSRTILGVGAVQEVLACAVVRSHASVVDDSLGTLNMFSGDDKRTNGRAHGNAVCEKNDISPNEMGDTGRVQSPSKKRRKRYGPWVLFEQVVRGHLGWEYDGSTIS